jgi:tetratricopeptide (TPR) repeat protein
MGALYLARDPSLDRLVAIKLLKEDYQHDPELRERFIREARSVARLRHPNIVVVHDVGEDDGRPFMAMEYIAGDTLNQVLRRTPTLPIVKRLALIEDLCAGLAHAHHAGIIHRDIKPTNIMLDGEGVLKVLDFGIARLGNSGMTQEGMMMGTVNYMSPEQVAGRNVDHRTDIFAAGAVLYEAVALAQAFPGGIDSGVLHRLLNEGPVPLDKRVPGVDRELAGIVRKALDPDPARRYQDANVMRFDLSRIRRRLAEEGESEAAAGRDTTVVDHSKSARPGSSSKIESERGRRLTPERVAELRRQQVEEYLRFGEEAFARGEHDAALQHAERAATVDPDSRAAIDLLDKARLAIEAKATRQLLAEAQRLLTDGHIEDAAALADEASVTLPDIHGAAELRKEVRATVDRIAAVRQREQRIAASLDRARASLDQGGYETALRAVYEVLALDPDRSAARALEQEAKARLEAQRERERLRRSAYDELARARSLAADGKYEEAVEAISRVTGPSDTLRMSAADALAAVRSSQRQAAQAGVVAAAKAAFGQGRLEEALAALDSIPADEQTPAATVLRNDVERVLHEQRELERKRRALETAIETVQKFIGEDKPAKALERLEEAAAIGLEDERIAALRQQIAGVVEAAEERRRQEVRDRVAAKRVEAARQLLANGDGYAAIALLERDGSGHPTVQQALRDVRVAVAEYEERVRKEAERRRKEEEARRRAEVEAARKLEEQNKAEEQRRRLEEERRRQEAEQRRRREEVTKLLVEAEAALAARRPEEAAPILKHADEQMVLVDDSDLHSRIAVARAEADRLERERLEEIRRREEDARQREEALTRILTRVRSTPEHTVALDLLNDALTLAPSDRRVQDLAQERRAALDQQRIEEERRRHEERRREEERRAQEEEARRRAEAEAARLREEQRKAAEKQRQEEEDLRRRQEVAGLLTTAEQVVAERPDEAARVLAQAEAIRLLRKDPNLTQRLTTLRAEVTHQKKEAVRREQEARRREEEVRKREEEARRRAAAFDDLLTRAGAEDAHEAALTLLTQAQTLAPNDRRVETLIHERRSALEVQREEQRRREEIRKREEEARKQEESLTRLLDKARSEDQHEVALTLLGQAKNLAPGDERVETLIRTRSDALEAERAAAAARAAEQAVQRERERREQEERDGLAAATAQDARKLYAVGRHGEAIALLRKAPPHALIEKAARELESLLAELERRRRQEERRRQRAERRAATGAAIGQAVSDRRLQAAAVVLLGIALVWGGWRVWPTAPPQVDGRNASASGTSVSSVDSGATPPSPQVSPSAPAASLPPPAQQPARREAPSSAPTAPPLTAPSPRAALSTTATSGAPASPQTGPGTTREEPALPPVPRTSPQETAPAPPPPLPTPQAPTPTQAPGGQRSVTPTLDLASEREAIEQLLNEFVAAYSTMDDSRLRRIDPTFTGIQRRTLIRSVRLSLPERSITFSPDGQTATLRATGTYTYVWNGRDFPPTSPAQLNWKLQKTGRNWTVVP